MKGLNAHHVRFWREFAAYLPKLETLAVRRIDDDNMPFIKFKHLVHIDVDYVGSADDNIWVDFCNNNPNIEFFHIFAKYRLEYFLGKAVIVRDNLKKLKDFCINH
jgi:hypothetical protein